MAAYDIKLDNGWIHTVVYAESESDALARLKGERERMGYKITNATEIRKMKESYGNGGYNLVALEDFHQIIQQS